MLKNPPTFRFPHFLLHPFTEQNGLMSLSAFGTAGGVRVRSTSGLSSPCSGVVTWPFQVGKVGGSALAGSLVEVELALWASARDGVRRVVAVLLTPLP